MVKRVTESEIGLAALRIAAAQPSGTASIETLKQHISSYIDLSAADQTQSVTRPNEEMWEQQVRNLISHRSAEGNIVAEGLADYTTGSITITAAGRLFLRNKGLL